MKESIKGLIFFFGILFVVYSLLAMFPYYDTYGNIYFPLPICIVGVLMIVFSLKIKKEKNFGIKDDDGVEE